MKLRERGTRRVLGTCLSALIVTLSVAVPLLERADLARETAVESEHHSNTCAPSHDHTICTQVGASHALPSRQDLRVGVTPFVGSRVAGHLRMVFAPARVVGPPTRAPPTA